MRRISDSPNYRLKNLTGSDTLQVMRQLLSLLSQSKKKKIRHGVNASGVWMRKELTKVANLKQGVVSMSTGR